MISVYMHELYCYPGEGACDDSDSYADCMVTGLLAINIKTKFEWSSEGCIFWQIYEWQTPFNYGTYTLRVPLIELVEVKEGKRKHRQFPSCESGELMLNCVLYCPVNDSVTSFS